MLATRLSWSECVRRLEAKAHRDIPILSDMGFGERMLVRWRRDGFRIRVRPTFIRNGFAPLLYVRPVEDATGCALHCRSALPLHVALLLSIWFSVALMVLCVALGVATGLLPTRHGSSSGNPWRSVFGSALATAVMYAFVRLGRYLGERQNHKAIAFLCETLNATQAR
ncbi:MAG TPA: hypothetical protein VJV78_29685 [Polyangiales bacterium]|nr:hypothetical protein [Polyangiales bacterium]